MAELEAAKKARKSTKIWLTRSANTVNYLLNETDTDFDAVQESLCVVQTKLEAFDRAQAAVEVLLPTDSLEEDIGEAADYRDDVEKTVRLTKRYLREHQRRPELSGQAGDGVNQLFEDDASSLGSSVVLPLSVKLPDLKIAPFNGEVAEWQSFWDAFDAAIHQSQLSKIAKFNYLNTLLIDEAKRVVEGLSLTVANYDTACELLRERFGRREQIIFAHIQGVLNLQPCSNSSSTKSLRSLEQDLVKHVRCLEAQGIQGDSYGVILTPLILSKLPDFIRLDWARECKEGDLSFLMSFMLKEIQARERSEVYTSSSASSREERESKTSRPTARRSGGAAVALHIRADCPVCGRAGHTAAKCFDLTKAPVSQRRNIMMKAGLCFRCLTTGSGHDFRRCNAACVTCGGGHHVLLCDQRAQPQNGVSSSSNSSQLNTVSMSSVNVSNAFSNVSILQTVQLMVQGADGPVPVTAMLDCGADRSCVTSTLVKKLKGMHVLGRQSVSFTGFGGTKLAPRNSNVYQFAVFGNATNESVLITAIEVPTICSVLQQAPLSKQALGRMQGLHMADDYCRERSMRVDVLIGMDLYWRVVNGETLRLSEGLVAINTKFGWVLSGSEAGTPSNNVVSINHVVSETLVRSMWELDGIGVSPAESVRNDDHPVLKEFIQGVEFDGERYVVQLPWNSEFRNGKVSLQDNRVSAKGRLQSLQRKLSRDSELRSAYSDCFLDMEKRGIIREVAPEELVCKNPTFYLPHRPVVKMSSTSTKVRPVFDASACGPNGVSLNDCLSAGPSLVPDLVEILLRFRRWKVAVTADVQKAFHQIRLRDEDCDVHRFLLSGEGEVRIMKFQRVPFGNKSSPFLLNATVRHHLSQFTESPVVGELRDNLYVDDWLSGADSEETALAMFQEALSIMDKAGMPLKKWNSNSNHFVSIVTQESGEQQFVTPSDKILGVKWIPDSDCFGFDGMAIVPELLVTKRVVLSFIARLYDPLGFISPFVMSAKILFQKIWRLGIAWDDFVPEEINNLFISWLRDMESLKEWKIPRRFVMLAWSEVTTVELHAFSDASELAYGSVVYLCVRINGVRHCSLVLSRARVAPLKKATLPRLELMGALLSCRLILFVRNALRLSLETPLFFWTDSKIVLSWIKGDPSRWKPFVANRVHEIQDASDPSSWFHCKGTLNPADYMTRGFSAKELKQSNWLNGPNVDELLFSAQGEVDVVDGEEEVAVLVSRVVVLNVFDVARWSSLSKAVRVFAWVRRFMQNARLHSVRRTSNTLSAEELESARLQLLVYSQKLAYPDVFRNLQKGVGIPRSSPILKLNPYLESDGLLRVKGRLQLSKLSFETKHPVILSNGPLALLIVQFYHHLLKHPGVPALISHIRGIYWIVGLRRIAKRVKRECVSCQRLEAKAFAQPTPPLPLLRVQEAPPFTVCGLDFAGPLYCADHDRKKFYILLMTCAVSRAVHLEMTESLSLRDFLFAFRRFVSRRGIPSVLYSDNATTFHGAVDKLRGYFGDSTPKWRFIAPASPWWGGWWERLVRSVKLALRKTLGYRSACRVELETLLAEVEACVNSRPLTFVGDDLDASQPLSPSHFLLGKPSALPVDVNLNEDSVSPGDLSAAFLSRKERLGQFWDRWSRDYLANLPPLSNRCQKPGDVQTGSVVLIRNENLPRLQWPVGVITEVFAGIDGIVRTVKVKTSKGEYVRPVQRLHDLEVARSPVPSVSEDEVPEQVEQVRRSGRSRKPTNRLDL